MPTYVPDFDKNRGIFPHTDTWILLRLLTLSVIHDLIISIDATNKLRFLNPMVSCDMDQLTTVQKSNFLDLLEIKENFQDCGVWQYPSHIVLLYHYWYVLYPYGYVFELLYVGIVFGWTFSNPKAYNPQQNIVHCVED